jgi:hypothetical protein
MADYADVYLRQRVGQGAAHVAGCAAPDLIPWGPTADPAPDQLATEASWSTDPGRPLVVGDNHVYVRGCNAGSSSQKTRLFLGAQPPTLLAWPDALVAVPASDGKLYCELTIAAGAIGVGAVGFTCPVTSPGAALAAWAYTQAHRITPPSTRSIAALADFFATTPAYVQRSVGVGLTADRYELIATYDQRDDNARMVFELDWVDCPAGWTVAMVPVAGGDAIAIAPTTIESARGSLASSGVLPEQYTTSLALRIASNGIAALPTTVIRWTANLVRDGAGRVVDRGGAPVEVSLMPIGGHEWRPAAAVPLAHPHRHRHHR